MCSQRVLWGDNGYEKVLYITHFKILFLWQYAAARETTHHQDLFKAFSFLTSLHFLLIPSPIKICYRDLLLLLLFGWIRVPKTGLKGCISHKFGDIVFFTGFPDTLQTQFGFACLHFRLVKIVALIPGLRLLYAACGVTCCIFCASTSCAVFCLPVCQDS